MGHFSVHKHEEIIATFGF